MLMDGFAIAGVVVCVISMIVGIAMTVIRTFPADSSILSLALVELYLVVYGIQAAVRHAGSAPLLGAGWEFWGYLATALLLVPLAAWWAIGDKSRWSNTVMAAAGFTVLVMLVRMQQVWHGQGFFAG
ncbi:hypothetical protein HMPREF3160_07475 [Arthrobacter sp. HMSC06H05]|nr:MULTISPECIES: hypothetical protein [Micrococcaceae]MCG7304552.1 hypothetical protein [Pseudoglutamicibacter albus]OFT23693.1 hypothetical protein HMPREF3175_03670 [Arthrobacter sp. HMSC08H08]OFT41611.1 hypothetical protein HMPREF3160_07475 [Arthrobacter sp. HMSC06H05]